MRLILFIVVGLVVGAAGGTAFRGIRERDVILARMAREKAAAEAAEASHGENEAHQDPSGAGAHSQEGTEASSFQDTLSVDGGEAPRTDGEGEAEAHLSGEVAAPEGSGLPPGGTPFAIGEPAPWSASRSAASDEGPARLAKIFGAMEAKDAAAVLEKLEDSEVQAILFHMSDRKAAEILGKFSTERAATLSRAVLGSSSGNGS